MIPRRATASVATGVLVLAGASVALAPSAHAETIRPTVTCVLPAGQGTFTGEQDVTVTLDKTQVVAGELVTATVTLGQGPAVSPLDLKVFATPKIILGMSGAATGQVMASGPEFELDVKAGESPPIPTYSGTFNVPAGAAQGKIDFHVVTMLTDTRFAPGVGDPLVTDCTVVAGGETPIGEVTVGEPTGEAATVSVPDTPVKPGATFPLTGAHFTPNATPQIALCNAEGVQCDPEKFTSNALSIDGQGALAGSVTLTSRGLVEGDFVVQVSDGTKLATGTLMVKPEIAAERTAVADIDHGPLGTVVTITGEGFAPNSSANLVPVDADNITLGDPPRSIPTDSNGEFVFAYEVTNPGTIQLRLSPDPPG